MHSVNCTYHPYGSHSLHDIELMIDQDLGDFKTYNQHMDNHVGIMTEDLSVYINRLDGTVYPYMRMKFNQDNHHYFSILVGGCPGYFIEIIAEKVS